MKHKARLACMLAALAVAGTSLAAPKPVSKERQAAVARIAQNHRHFAQPHTMAEAARTEVAQPDGTVAVAVPTELWNEMSATRDANGQLHVREADGTAAASTEAAANE